jgi:hypothetical protein
VCNLIGKFEYSTVQIPAFFQGEPDRYYNIYSHYYNLPYRHFYFNRQNLINF